MPAWKGPAGRRNPWRWQGDLPDARPSVLSGDRCQQWGNGIASGFPGSGSRRHHPDESRKRSRLSSVDEYSGSRRRVLWLSTVAFTLLFNVWLMMGVLGISIRKDLGLSDSQLEWLIAAAILSGALLRLNFGIWADAYGGRRIMGLLLLGTAIPTYLFGHATTYGQMLVCAILFGIAGNSFSAGVSWNSAWIPQHQKGSCLLYTSPSPRDS